MRRCPCLRSTVPGVSISLNTFSANYMLPARSCAIAPAFCRSVSGCCVRSQRFRVNRHSRAGNGRESDPDRFTRPNEQPERSNKPGSTPSRQHLPMLSSYDRPLKRGSAWIAAHSGMDDPTQVPAARAVANVTSERGSALEPHTQQRYPCQLACSAHHGSCSRSEPARFLF